MDMQHITPQDLQKTVDRIEASEQRQLEDRHVLQRDDFRDISKKRALQFQTIKSLLRNYKAGVDSSVLLRNISNQETYIFFQEDEPHYASSINKLAIALVVLQDLQNGKITLDTVIDLPEAQARLQGPGVFDDGDVSEDATVRDLLYDMLNKSSNTAVQAIVDYYGGAPAMNDRLAQISELKVTRLHILADGKFALGDTTARESLLILERIAIQNDQYAEFMKDAMATNIFEEFGVRSQIGNTERITLVNKIAKSDGKEANFRHDLGVIYNNKTGTAYSYAFLTTTPVGDEEATERAEESLQEMGRHFLRFAGDKRASKWHEGRKHRWHQRWNYGWGHKKHHHWDRQADHHFIYE